MIDVCLCTHNPRPGILAKVLASIEAQTVGVDAFRLLVVDNASSPPIDEALLLPFTASGINARLVREPLPGIARARLRAIVESDAEWLLFVDDDNELTPQYISEGMLFAEMFPDVGCFGGKLLLPENIRPARWIEPFLPYFAIKDIGDEPVVGKCATWGPWEPPTAGAFIRRSVLSLYEHRAQSDKKLFLLGRKGSRNLLSCEDSLIMRGAFSLDLACAYNPGMILYHHLDAKRFNFSYLIRLMYAYGISHVILETLLNGLQPPPEYYSSRKMFLRMLLGTTKSAANQSLAFGIGIAAYHLGARNEHLRQNQTKP